MGAFQIFGLFQPISLRDLKFKQWIHEWNGEGGKEETLIKRREQVHVHWQHITIYNATCYKLIMINVNVSLVQVWNR
jgi:hypothetical protein